MTGDDYYPTTRNLFLDTVDDLYQRARPRGSRYDAVQVAGLLRRLLCDTKSPLITLANEEPRLEVRFRATRAISQWHRLDNDPYEGMEKVGPYVDPLQLEVVKAMAVRPGIWANGPPAITPAELDQTVKILTVKQFLAFHVGALVRPDVPITVVDLIRAYANQLGGVHVQPSGPPNPVHLWIAADESSARDTVLSLGRITHRALLPLFQWHEWAESGGPPFFRPPEVSASPDN